MKSYYRLMLGAKSKHAADCLSGNFVGTDFHIHQDLSGHLPSQWRDFNREFIPVYLKTHPEKSKVAAGLTCGAIWTVSESNQTVHGVIIALEDDPKLKRAISMDPVIEFYRYVVSFKLMKG